MDQRVAIIGAGYAGLAAAVELADADIKVDVFEASRTLGGRARTVELDGLSVDNGAHILVGAYRETLRLMQKVGAGGTALRREPLHLEFPGKVKISAPPHCIPAPAPLHLAWALLTAQGLSFADKLAAIRFMRTQQARNFRLAADITAAELFSDQPERVRRYLWEPLCLAALNTPVAIASAQVFLNVLRDSLAADRAASD
ncbi:MAG: FAD-dependent oxidoreductase, partial [Rhodocyclaceae bacterium]|nr:FAD-dependent oxidoreductase [Rhodocyclaceae bacterium]